MGRVSPGVTEMGGSGSREGAARTCPVSFTCRRRLKSQPRPFQKAPEPLGPVELGPQQPEAEAEESSDEEEPVESRARRPAAPGWRRYRACEGPFQAAKAMLRQHPRLLSHLALGRPEC